MEKQSTRKFLKLIVALVAFFLLGASALLFASCNNEHEHAWADEPVESVPPTCTSNGSNTFTCTVEGCTETNVVVVPALGHDYQLDSAQSSDPTCTQNGQDVFRCSRCDDTYSVTKLATGHDLGEPVTVEATCSKAGSITRTCQNEGCGEQEVQVIPATGHSWDNGTVEVAATCAQEGTRVYKCTHDGCNAERTESIPVSSVHGTRVLDEELSTDATCAANGTNVYVCSVCNDVLATTTVPATTKHDMQKVEEIAPSCEENGRQIWQCQNCTYSYEKEIEGTLLGHDYVVNTKLSNYIAATCVTEGRGTFECTRCEDEYYGVIGKLAPDGVGHTWAPNTNEDDELLGYPEGSAEAAKEDGWSTVVEQNCTTGGKYERVCSVCGVKETKTSAAAGHIRPEGATVCGINTSLVDANDQAIYAFECQRENCPVEVEGKDGNSYNWIKATAHTYGNWVVDSVLSCTSDYKRHRTCEVCGDVDEEIEKTPVHAWNSKQLDGETTAVACVADPDFTLANINKALKDYYGTNDEKRTEIYEIIEKNMKAAQDKAAGATVEFAQFCFVCGEVQVATGHSWVISTLVEGKWGLNDYQKEDGKPVVAEDVTTETMTCRNVVVCKNCGTPDYRGQCPEDKITTATCREDGICQVCKEPHDPQLQHDYIRVETILSYANSTNANEKALYDAYIAVSGIEGNDWMKGKTASCVSGEEGIAVFLCKTCLLDAVNEEIPAFDWTQAEIEEDDLDEETQLPERGYAYCAYTMEYLGDHEYEAVYYDVRATSPSDTARQKAYEQTNCEFGYKVAYICPVCGDVYSGNADDDRANDAVEGVTVNTAGWVMKNGAVDEHKGDHVVYVPENYKRINTYVAPTCVEEATLPVYCVNCGKLDLYYSYDDIAAVLAIQTANPPEDVTTANDGYNFTLAVSDTNNIPDGAYYLSSDTLTGEGDLVKETQLNPNKHAEGGANMYACGEHCKAVNKEGEVTYYCVAIVDGATSVTDQDENGTDKKLPIGANTDEYHATIYAEVVSSTLNYDNENTLDTDKLYLAGYSLYIAFVEEDDLIKSSGDPVTVTGVNWDTVKLGNEDHMSNCEGDKLGLYTLPGAYDAENPAAGKYIVLQHNATGTIYPLEEKNINYYTDDNPESTTNKVVDEEDGNNSTPNTPGIQVTITQRDKFFVRVIGDGQSAEDRPAVPATVVDEASLVLAAENPVYDEDANTYTVYFDAETTIDLAGAEDATVTGLLTAINSLKEVKEDAELIFEMNNSTINVSGDDNLTIGGKFFDTGIDTLTIKDGTINFTGLQKVDEDDTAVSSFALVMNTNATGNVVLDNVKLNSNQNGISIAADTKGNITLQNGTTLTANGVYGIYIADEDAAAVAAADLVEVLTMNNSNVTVQPAAGQPAVLSTALFIGAPVEVSVTGGKFAAQGQAVVVRQGTLAMSGATLEVLAGYTEATLDDEAVVGGPMPETEAALGGKEANILPITAPNFAWVTEIKTGLRDYTPGETVQYYRTYGVWGTKNAVVRAALVIGNSDLEEYQLTTSVTLSDITYVELAGIETVAIASHYAKDTMYTGGDTDTTVETMVTVKSDVDLSGAVLANTIPGSVSFTIA